MAVTDAETAPTKTRRARVSKSAEVDYSKPAGAVVQRLGGLSAVCRASAEFRDGKPYVSSTVWGWMKKGVIPINEIPVFKAIGDSLRPRVKLADSDFIPK